MLRKNEGVANIVDKIHEQVLREYASLETVGVHCGQSGLILFLANYAQAVSMDTLKDTLNLRRCIETTLDKISETYQTYSFSSGIAGFCWTLLNVHKIGMVDCNPSIFYESNIFLEKKMFEEFEQRNLDFLHGGLGLLYYFLYYFEYARKKRLKECSHLKNILSDAIALLLARAEQDKQHIKWESINARDNVMGYNLGVAHGIPSILLVLIHAYEMNICRNSEIEAILRKIVQFLQYATYPNHSSSIFPNFIEKETLKYFGPSRLAWCYGDLGIAYAIYKCGRILGDQTFVSYAIDVVRFNAKKRTAIETSIIDPGLCHGSSGVAYLFKKFARQDTSIYQAYRHWTDHTLGFARNDSTIFPSFFQSTGWIKNIDFLDGTAGIGCFLLTEISKKRPFWDASLLLQ